MFGSKTLVALFAVLVVGAAVGAPSKASPKVKESREDVSLPEPKHLPELARAFLRQKMQNHGRDMQGLVRSVILLKYASANELATKIASEPRLVRPILGGDNDLNAALPEQLFVLQDELRSQSNRLAEAAAKQDDVELAASFARVTQACISCHSAYLTPPEKKD